jgi:NitT/TauT family transport system ATP-binding protein
MMENNIEIRDLEKIFREKDNSKITAIKDINLEVKDGEFVSIIGPSGCGKTTLLKIMAGFVKPTRGKITIRDNLPHENKNKSLGFVFQNPTLLPWRNVIDNICLPLEVTNKNSNKKQNIKIAKKLLKTVDLIEFKDNLPNELSRGMQQRVAIARALMLKPTFLLMDEPFSSLDEINRNKMNMELLKIWNNINTTILYVTHSVQEAIFLADKVVILSKRPAKVKKIINIPFLRPRNQSIIYTKEYNKILKNIQEILIEDNLN